MCQGAEKYTPELKGRGRIPPFKATLTRAEESPLLGSGDIQRPKRLRYWYQVSSITIAPSKTFLEPLREDDECGQTEENDETVEHAQEPSHLRKGDKPLRMSS